MASEHLREEFLVYRRLSRAQGFDLRIVIVDADDTVTDLGKADSGDESNISGAYNAD
jgi:hypothetical protein